MPFHHTRELAGTGQEQRRTGDGELGREGTMQLQGALRGMDEKCLG